MEFQVILIILTSFVVCSNAVSYKFNRINLSSPDPQFMLSIRQIDNLVTAYISNSNSSAIQYHVQTHTPIQYTQFPNLLQNVIEVQTSDKDANGNIKVGIVSPSTIMVYNYNFTEQIDTISSGIQYQGMEFGTDSRTVYFYGLQTNGNYRIYKYDLILKSVIGYVEVGGTPTHFQFKDSQLILMINIEENNETFSNSTKGMNTSNNISSLNETLNQTINSTNITNDENNTINSTNSTSNNTANTTNSTVNSTSNNTSNTINSTNSTSNNTATNSTVNSTVNNSCSLDSPNNSSIITSELLILDQDLGIVKEFPFPNPYIKSIKNLSFNDHTHPILGNSSFHIYDNFQYAAISQGNRLDIWDIEVHQMIKEMILGLEIDEVVSCYGFLMVSVYDMVPVQYEVNMSEISMGNQTNYTFETNVTNDTTAYNLTNSTISDNSTNSTISDNSANTTSGNSTNSTSDNSTNTTIQNNTTNTNSTNSSLPYNETNNSTSASDQLVNITVIEPAKILYLINQTTLKIHRRKWISFHHNSLTKLFCVNNHTLAFRLFTNFLKNLTEVPDEQVLPLIEENVTIIEQNATNATIIEDYQNTTKPGSTALQYQSETIQREKEETTLPREVQDTIDFLEDYNTKEGLSIVGSSIPVISSTIGQNVIKFFNFNIDIFSLYSMHPVKYTEFLSVFSKEMDLMAQLRIKPKFLDDIDLSKKVSFADQNERYKQTSGVKNIYLLEVLKEFYTMGIIVAMCMFIGMYLIRRLIGYLIEYHQIFQILYDILQFYTQWWMLIISIIETNLSITVFYFFLQLRQFYFFAFANKLNMCVTLLLGFIILIFLVAFYPMIYSTQKSKNTQKILDFTKYRLQGFFVMGIIKNYNIFLRSAVHGIFLNYSEQLLIILVINGSIIVICCCIFWRVFKNRLMFVVCSALMVSLIIFDLLLFLYLGASQQKAIDYEGYVFVSAMVIIGLSLLQNIIILSYDIFDAVAQCRSGNRIKDINRLLQEELQKKKQKCHKIKKESQRKQAKIEAQYIEDPPERRLKTYCNSPDNFNDIQFFSIDLESESPNKVGPRTAKDIH